MSYQSTWINPYLPQNAPASATGQSYIPSMQAGMQNGWQQPQQPMQYQQPMQQQPVNGIVKVNGRDSALQIQLPPNSTSVPLIDSSFDGKRGTFYVVSTDGTGSKSVEAFDFSPHVEQSLHIDGAQFVSRQEYDEFVAKVSAALGALSNVTYEPVQAAAGTRAADGTASVDAVRRPDPSGAGSGQFGGNMPDA